MEYKAPFGGNDWNASYVDRNTPGAIAGSRVPGAAIEHPQRELHHLIAYFLGSGSPLASDLQQVRKAIQAAFPAELPNNAAIIRSLARGIRARWGTPGTYIFTVPASVTSIYGVVIGAGGGGGGQKATGLASGGGGGGRTEGRKAVTPGQTLLITVGAPGAGGIGSGTAADPTNGSAGGSSSIGSLMSSTGGGGGFAAASGIQGQSGAPGLGSGGDINRSGFGGGTGFSNIGGQGGGLYGTSASPLNSGSPGQPGYAPGGGGSGASGNAGNGGNGADGEVIIEY